MLKASGSPMPFGSDPFRDLWYLKIILLTSVGHQCLSAVIPFGTKAEKLERRFVRATSPMPFGSDPFRDQQAQSSRKQYITCHQCLSAVIPFGTVFRISVPQWGMDGVTNAFRQ